MQMSDEFKLKDVQVDIDTSDMDSVDEQVINKSMLI